MTMRMYSEMQEYIITHKSMIIGGENTIGENSEAYGKINLE